MASVQLRCVGFYVPIGGLLEQLLMLQKQDTDLHYTARVDGGGLLATLDDELMSLCAFCSMQQELRYLLLHCNRLLRAFITKDWVTNPGLTEIIWQITRTAEIIHVMKSFMALVRNTTKEARWAATSSQLNSKLS